MGFHEDLKQSFQDFKEVFIDPLANEIDEKQDTLTPGTGINIVNNVISATAGETGGHTIENSSGTDLITRNTMKFNSPFTATDNAISEITEIGLQQMSSSEIDDIVSPLPNSEFTPRGLNNLDDVNITTPSNGQVLKYNATSKKWENSSSGGGSAASDSSYDNTDSGLEADNLQDAIDEVNSNVSSKQNSTDNSLNTTSKNIVGAINEVNSNVSNKQNSTDNSLNTTSKNIVGAINEVNANKGSTITLGGQSVNVSMTLSGDVLTITTS